MSLSKFDTIKKAINENRRVEFVFKQDGTLREVEVYDYYVDDNGYEKLWVYQTHKDGSRVAGVRVFFEYDVTYAKLAGSFRPRDMKEAPKKVYSV